MIVYLIDLLILCFVGIKFQFKDGFADYAGKNTTDSIKGIFVIIVVLSHVRQYISLAHVPLNDSFVFFMHNLEQLMVVMFLFYSGYGVALSIQKKQGYVKTLPVKRALRVYIHFLFALSLFYITGVLLDKHYSAIRVLKSMIGTSGLGNSSWFIFVILFLYIATWISFSVFKNKMIPGLVATTVLSAILTVLVFLIKGESNHWWYDTIMTYPLGMWFYMAKPQIDKKLLSRPGSWAIATSAVCISFAVIAIIMERIDRPRWLFIIETFVFAAMVILLSMRIKVDNVILRWTGRRIFGIYMLQRIPMIVLQHFELNTNPYAFTLTVLAITFIIAELFERCMDKVDILLKFSKKPAEIKS